MSRSHVLRLLLLACSSLPASAVCAQAGTPPPSDADSLAASGSGQSVNTIKTDTGEIIVTASHYVPVGAETANKANIPLIQTPQSITVITRDQIDLLNFIDAQQAVRYTAGVSGESYGPDPRYDFVTVRGFTPKQYIDGLAVPATTTIAATGVDLYAFQSLDILKGPASVLYGSAPPGGILNEVSRRPASQFGGEFLGKYGTNDFKELAGTVTGPAAPFLDMRFTGLYRDTALTIDHTKVQRVLASPSATLKLGPNTRLTGLLYYQYDNDSGGSGGFLPYYGTAGANPNGRIARSTNLDDPHNLYERHQTGAGFEFEHRFSPGLSFISNTKWSHYREETPLGLYSGGGFTNVTNPTKPSYYRTLQQYNFAYEERVVSFASDNRVNASVTTGPVTQKLLVGVDYRNVRNDANYGFALGGLVDAFAPTYNPAFEHGIGFPTRYNQQRLQQTGVYAQDQLGLGHLYLLLSGRYDWVHARTAKAFVDVTAPEDYTGQKQHKFTYRVGLNYVSPSGLAPYIGYATSFEPLLGQDTSNPMAPRPFKPTSAKQIEGGLKFDARGLGPNLKLFATAAGFDIKESNFVTAQVGQTPVGAVQGGLVEVYGAEFEVVARFRERLSVNASYSYNHSRIRSSPNAPGDIGFPLPTTPRHKASLFADYTIPAGLLAGFGLGGGVRYNSRSAGGLPSTTSPQLVPGQPITLGQATLFDATLHYDLPGWRFAVNASNLADKAYVARCAGLYGCVYGAARQVIGTITKRF